MIVVKEGKVEGRGEERGKEVEEVGVEKKGKGGGKKKQRGGG